MQRRDGIILQPEYGEEKKREDERDGDEKKSRGISDKIILKSHSGHVVRCICHSPSRLCSEALLQPCSYHTWEWRSHGKSGNTKGADAKFRQIPAPYAQMVSFDTCYPVFLKGKGASVLTAQKFGLTFSIAKCSLEGV